MAVSSAQVNASRSVPMMEHISPEDVDLIQRIHRILKRGFDAEISRDASGKPKVFAVSKKIEQ